jgi:enoyl-CoA hydratase
MAAGDDPTGAAPLVRLALDGPVARLRLDDPATRNALSPRLSLELADAVGAALADGARVIVLTAAAPVFCSGGSLDELLEPTHPLDDAYAGFLALAAATVPTIAVVDGAVVGAGVNLALACDVVLVSPDARFDPRFLDVGIHPGGGHLQRLWERVGRQGAAALALLGDRLTGEEAVVAGLAWRCVPRDALDATAQRYVDRVVSRPAELVRRAKDSLDRSGPGTDPAEARALERAAQEWSMAQPFFAERVAALRARVGGAGSATPGPSTRAPDTL